MALTDPIADFLVRLKNASFAKKESLECPSSNIRKSICEILKREGFIRDFRIMKDNRQGLLKIYLKYSKDKLKISAITCIKRVSKSGLRIYKRYNEIPKVLAGRGIALVSTSKGILTDDECRQVKSGGEIICQVW